MRKKTGFVVWMTGMSGAGKTTLARALRPAIAARQPVEVLDGDDMREHISAELSFTREDRAVNVRRIGFLARLLARNGVGVIVAAISPYADTRAEVRRQIEAEGLTFIEVHVHAALAALVARDTKGLYRKALAGEIQNFTGVSDPYQAPAQADVVIDTASDSIEAGVERLAVALGARGLLEMARA